MNKQAISVALRALQALADTIRECGQAPGGTLYAALMAHGCTLSQFDSMIGILRDAGLIRTEPSGLVCWIGPSDWQGAKS